MRVIRIGERYSIATGEVETYDLLPVKTYVAMYNERGGLPDGASKYQCAGKVA